MNEERFEKFIEFLKHEIPDTCPIVEADIDENELPFCNENYCESYGGVECWKRWIRGDAE